MTLLVTGSNGMLGREVSVIAQSQGLKVVGLDLSNADMNIDMTDDDLLVNAFQKICPEVVVNCAAVVDVALCDTNPFLAWKVNARTVALLAELCRQNDSRLIQVSTDHYFSGDESKLHDESAPVTFLNEYARTKFAGESFALSWEKSLVLRTNVIGLRGHGNTTFAEWAFDAVENDREITLFEDAFVSSIDTESLSEAILKLVEKSSFGLFNVANHDVFSKKALIEKMAEKAGCTLTHAKAGSVKQLGVRRADSCGLDVSKVEKVLGYKLPTLDEVVTRLIERRKAIYEG